MKYCIFLCTKKWQILKILQQSGDFDLNEDNNLTDFLSNPNPLLESENFEVHSQNLLSLKLCSQEKETPAIVVTYPKHFLVFLISVTTEEEFLAFAKFYVRYLSWADDNLKDTYDDGYLQIQQMNNQLLNFQRALMKSNHQLAQTLSEVRDANNTIALLERDDLTDLYRASAFYRKAENCLAESEEKPFDMIALSTINGQTDSVRIGFYNHSIHEKLLFNHQILDSIPNALKNKEFKLYLQPKVDMNSETVIGAEALIRWIHPKLGFIPPDSFIPLLENEGDIYHVDQYIWEEACRFLKMRRDSGLRCFPVSINIARAVLYEDDLADVLLALLKKYELDPKELHLEIIERAYVNDSSTIFPVLTKLRSLGFVIEMDDFGTGESSLAMLSEMPIDVIKLDRHFLITAAGSKRQAEIVRFIVNLSKTLGLSIIAEGVETHDDEQLLVSMGCFYAQGYLYGKPLPAEEFCLPEENVTRATR